MSTGPFSSLNTAVSTGDAPEAVAENLARLAGALKLPAQALLTVSQVHGDRVVEGAPAMPSTEADAVWTRHAHCAVGVKTADCVPILIEDRRQQRVAAVHAGWRGVISQIVHKALGAMGSNPNDVFVAIGPAIQKCCFEVDGDLPARFSTAFGGDVVVTVAGKSKKHLDLSLAVQRTLERAGVPPSHIDALAHCTHCDSRFFSHRRDHGRTGRHLSLIACEF